MTYVTSRPLLLLLMGVVAALVANAHAEALNCSEALTSTKDSPVSLPLDQQATTSIRFTVPKSNDKWDATFGLGFIDGEHFVYHIVFDIKARRTANFHHLKLQDTNTSAMLLNERVANTWLNDGGQVTLYIRESTFTIALQRPDAMDRKLLLELTDPQIGRDMISVVKVVGDMEVEGCEGPERVPEVTTTTTTPETTVPTTEPTTTTATTTTTTPTTTTPATTTTTTPATTTSSPTTTPSPTTTEVFTTSQDDTTTTTEDESPHPCLPAEDSKAGPGVTVCTPVSEPVIEVGDSEECQVVPRWAWACAALAVVFFVFSLCLIAYSITLYKRSWKSREEGLRENNSGGFGMSAQDVYYYDMNNTNMMIGNTVPRIRTPMPSPTPGLSPSHSTCRLSQTYPSTPSPSPTPNTLHVPAEGGGGVVDNSSHQNTRDSKVSFADD